MGQIKLTASLIFIALFTTAILSFAINFAIDNDSVIDIADDSELTSLSSKIDTNLTAITDSGAEDSYESIVGTTISPDAGTAQSAGPFAITPINAVGVAISIMKTGYSRVFGTGAGFSIFLTSLTGFILFMLGLYVYKTLRGSPD